MIIPFLTFLTALYKRHAFLLKNNMKNNKTLGIELETIRLPRQSNRPKLETVRHNESKRRFPLEQGIHPFKILNFSRIFLLK